MAVTLVTYTEARNIQNFKTSLQNVKIYNRHILYLEENKFKGRKKDPQ